MPAKQCPMCYSQRVLPIKDSVYCEECCVYYTVDNGRPYPSALPIKETSQMALELCGRCRHGRKRHRIRCKTFQDYFAQLPHCKKCKIINKDFIKNQYYKNFVRYRLRSAVFGWLYLLALFAAFYLWSDSAEACILALFVIEYKRSRLSCRKVALLLLAAVQLGHLAFVRDVSGLYCVYRILFSRTVVFDMPGDLTSHDDLHSLLGRLNIGGLDTAKAWGSRTPTTK